MAQKGFVIMHQDMPVALGVDLLFVRAREQFLKVGAILCGLQCQRKN